MQLWSGSRKETMWTLVTGGAKELGREICLELAKEGHNVSIHYLCSEKEALTTASECRKFGVEAECIQGDLRYPEEFAKSYLKRFFPTRFLVNTVGPFLQSSVQDIKREQWEEIFSTNLFAPLLLIKALLPSLRSLEGAVVNLGVVGVDRFHPTLSCGGYSAAKAALWQATRSLARELAEERVRINMVSPGYLEHSVVMPAKLPMGRLASSKEVAKLILFLLSDSAGYITGQNIEIAGGALLER